MSLFSEVMGEVAILIEGGVYKQVPLYVRNGYLHAKLGSGYVRLYKSGETSKPKCRLETITWDQTALGTDHLGRLVDPALYQGARLLAPADTQKLLGTDS